MSPPPPTPGVSPTAPFARREREGLSDALAAAGPDASTLCAGWTTYDLAAHLVLRESSPLAMGMVLPPMNGLLERAMTRLKVRTPYPRLVERFRQGPPLLSVFRPSKVDRLANAVEFFVHHEDVLRAQPAIDGPGDGRPVPRELERRDQDSLWARIGGVGRLVARNADVGIELVRNDQPAVRRVRGGEPTLVVRGLPSELVLFMFGRGAIADVEIEGDPAAREAFDDSQLGI
jgi:uncharacterized protein (TIGR03085 family)